MTDHIFFLILIFGNILSGMSTLSDLEVSLAHAVVYMLKTFRELFKDN